VPAGFARLNVTPGGFADWLRHLPTRPEGTPVRPASAGDSPGGTIRGWPAVIALQPRARSCSTDINVLLRLRAASASGSESSRRTKVAFTSPAAIWRMADWAEGRAASGKRRQVEFRKNKPGGPEQVGVLLLPGDGVPLCDRVQPWKDTRRQRTRRSKAGDLYRPPWDVRGTR